MLGPGFLDLPSRPGKPRRTGITHVLHRELPLAQATDLLEQDESYVDVWKFGCVEVSAGTVPMEDAAKRDLIAAAAERFIVLPEVGSKQAAVRRTP